MLRRCLSVSQHALRYKTTVPMLRGAAASMARRNASAIPKVNETIKNEEAVVWHRGDGTEVPGVAYGNASDPGVVCIYEWWGVAPWTRAQAQYIADRGFRVLVPDLYRGKLSLEAKEAEHLMGGLDWQGAVEDVRGAVSHLKSEGSPKVGITGFCMGGALTLASAVLVDGLSAAAPFYGIPPAELADVGKCSIPVLAQFGDKDDMEGFSDPESAGALGEKLKSAGCEHDVVFVPGVGHGFVNDLFQEGIDINQTLGRPTDHEAAKAAMDRALDFLEQKLA